MPRRKVVIKREINPDPKYNSELVARFINRIMQAGKKSVARHMFYRAMDIIRDRVGKDPGEVFNTALENVKPVIEVKSRRVGGATYQVPVEVRPNRRVALAIRWIISYANSRAEKSMEEKLAAELVDAYNNRGSSIKKKEDTHKMAEANKAFAHYRW
ncbi:MAG TPA: 30S ribosomal protein S7 [Proteobacteria bacterium]|nr:30S ribosomal protein S7 [Pseudomonadota bacterium]